MTPQPQDATPADQLDALCTSLAALESAGQPDAVLDPIRQQIARLEAADAAPDHATTRDQHIHGDLVRGDSFTGDKYAITLADGATLQLPPDDAPVADLLAAYYRVLAVESGRLPLGVMDPQFVSASGGDEVKLANVYVDLDVTTPAPRDEESERGWALRLMRGEGDDRTPLLDALAEPRHSHAVLLGDAGSGKSTFVNYLAWLLAVGEHAELPDALRQPLVIRLVLREVAGRHIPANVKTGHAQLLWDALRDDLAACLGEAAANRLLSHIQSRFLREGGLLLLDGLDEVPVADHRRQALLQAIGELSGSLPAHARVLVTARPYAYADPDWQLVGFATLALAPFDEGQVTRFVERWYTGRCAPRWAGAKRWLRHAADSSSVH